MAPLLSNMSERSAMLLSDVSAVNEGDDSVVRLSLPIYITTGLSYSTVDLIVNTRILINLPSYSPILSGD